MSDSIEWLRLLIQEHHSFQYSIVFLGVIFGGELVLFTLGFLSAQGVLSFLPVIILSFIGTFVPNILWFLLGKTTTADKIASHRYTNSTISNITEAVHRASGGGHIVALTIIKFLIGTPVVLMMYANKTGLTFKKFIYYQTFAILASMLVIIPIGFLSGLGFTYFSGILENLYAGFGFLLIIIIVVITVQLWLNKRFNKDISANDEKASL